jgi:hypothetical protein
MYVNSKMRAPRNGGRIKEKDGEGEFKYIFDEL